MKIHAIIAACLLFTIQTYAQRYTTAAGVRVGQQFGITVQQYVGKAMTVEVMAHRSVLSSNTTVAALLEKHINILGRRANLYVGGGPHTQFYKTGNMLTKDREWKNAFGLSAVGGVEVRLMRTVVSLDYKPMVNFGGNSLPVSAQAGLSIRYVFIDVPRKKITDNWPFGKKKGKNTHSKSTGIFGSGKGIL